MDRVKAASLGRQAIVISDDGSYQAPSGKTVDFRKDMHKAISGTISYASGMTLPLPRNKPFETTVDVTPESTLAAAQRLVREHGRVMALNFASATHPGGGFLTGALAQEESLARASGLYTCIAHSPMYAFHRGRRDPLYTDYMIYSPDVPVFRQDDGELLEEPYLLCILTAAAVNARQLMADSPSRQGEILPAMAARIDKVLALAAFQKHEVLLLGAWGCGAFGNDPKEIAPLFQRSLAGLFNGVFRRVVFAILDESADQHVITPFKRLFP